MEFEQEWAGFAREGVIAFLDLDAWMTSRAWARWTQKE
jgi:hypothetical protein